MAQPPNIPPPARGGDSDRRAPSKLLIALVEASKHIQGNHALAEALEILENATYEQWDSEREETLFNVGDRVRDTVVDRTGTFICSTAFDRAFNCCQIWFDDNDKSESWRSDELIAVEEEAT